MAHGAPFQEPTCTWHGVEREGESEVEGDSVRLLVEFKEGTRLREVAAADHLSHVDLSEVDPRLLQRRRQRAWPQVPVQQLRLVRG